jgi:HEAT repeat protein
VPLEVKKRTKVFIDMFVDRWFRGLAGGALLLLTAVLGFGVRQLSVVVMAMLLVWIALVVLIRKEYVGAFRSALARRELDPSQLTVNITDTATLQMLRDLLGSDNEREVAYALDILHDAGDESFRVDMERLLGHPSAEVKRRALEYLHGLGVTPDVRRVEPLAADPDPNVRLAAMHFVTKHSDGGEEALRSFIDSDDAAVSATALRCAADRDSGEFRHLITRQRVEQLAGSDTTGQARGHEVQVEVARALGALADRAYADVLRRLAASPSARVSGAAIEAMGSTHDREFVPELVELLADSSKRKHARVALVAYGDGVVGTLGDYLADESTDLFVRRNIPSVLSRIPTQHSADALTGNLANVDASLRFRVVKALNKLRKGYPELVIAQDRVDAAFVDETRMYYETLHVMTVCRGRLDTPGGRLLTRALEERLDHNLERIFRVLGLHYPPNDIYNAYLGIVSSNREKRASAIEFLDNVLGSNLKRYLFPIIDQVSPAVTLQRGRDLFDVDVASQEQALLRLIRGRDPWLRACAIYCCTVGASDEMRRAVEEAERDPDPLIRETAARVLRPA